MERKIIKGKNIDEMLDSIDAALSRLEKRHKLPFKGVVPITPIVITGVLNETKGLMPLSVIGRIVYIRGEFQQGSVVVINISKGNMNTDIEVPIRKTSFDSFVDVGKFEIAAGSAFSVYVKGQGSGVFGIAFEPVVTPNVRVEVEEVQE